MNEYIISLFSDFWKSTGKPEAKKQRFGEWKENTCNWNGKSTRRKAVIRKGK